MPRLFIAVPITSTPALTAIIDRLNAIGRPLKPVTPDQLHVTLAFLGDIDDALVPELREAMTQAATGVATQPVQLRGVGVFPDTRHPSVLWCGIPNGQWMIDLEARLRPWLDALKRPLDARPFHPHITLARVNQRDRRDPPPRDLRELLTTHADTDFGIATADNLHLIQSTLTPTGPIHQSLITVPIKAEG